MQRTTYERKRRDCIVAALSEKASQINMLSNIVQSLRVWVLRLWCRRTRSAKKKANSYPFSEPQGPAKESPEVPQELTPPAQHRQRPDTDSLENDHTTEVADNTEEANPQAGSVLPYSVGRQIRRGRTQGCIR